MEYLLDMLKYTLLELKRNDSGWLKLIEVLTGLRFGMKSKVYMSFSDVLWDASAMSSEDNIALWDVVRGQLRCMLQETSHMRNPSDPFCAIQKSMVMSTSHLKASFNNAFELKLDGDDAVSLNSFPVTIYKLGDIGYFLNVNIDMNFFAYDVSSADKQEFEGIDTVVAIAILACIHGCSSVIIDRDGPEWTQLPVYKW